MSSSILQRPAFPLTLTAPQGLCPVCAGSLPIKQHRKRAIRRLDEMLLLTLRDTACTNPTCPRAGLRYHPFQESTLALSSHQYGLDVVCAIGKMRFQDHFSFPRIFDELRQQGVPLCLMTVQYLFRDYLSLLSCQAGRTDGALRSRLQKQGAILPIIDGLQFGNGDPVLYLIFDALSKQQLFGKEFLARSKDDLVPFIAQLKELGIPILGVVSDKEKALVPAIAEALPGVPHQYCQLHFIKNAAKPMEDDLKALGAEVRQTEEELRDFERDLIHQQQKAHKVKTAVPADLPVARALGQAARAEARRQARAPFDPPAIRRHEGLETVAQAVSEARAKKKGLGPTSNALKVS